MFEGDKCKMEDCPGVLELEEKEGCCRCHISPPCSYCTDSSYVCDTCGEGLEMEEETPKPVKPSKQTYKASTDWTIPWEQRVLKEWDGKSIVWRGEYHTHFTMIKEGFKPPGATKGEVLKEIGDGTFGGRWAFWEDGATYFKYIAQTD